MFAACVAREKVWVPLAEIVVGDAVRNDGRAHVMLPIPEPEPLKVQVVVVQETPPPVNVKAPGVPLMLLTPDALELIV